MPAGVYTGGGATVVMDPPPVAYIKVFGPGGGPDRFLRRKAEQVAIMARALAPHQTYRLRASIRTSQNRDERGRFAFGYSVSANTPYAYYVHEGTTPHVYFSYPNKMRFRGTNDHSGRIVFTDMIDHPGTPANPFLQRSLVALAT